MNGKYMILVAAVLLLAAFAAAACSHLGEGDPTTKAPAGSPRGIFCKVDGREMAFEGGASAVRTVEGGMLLSGFLTNGSALMIQMPRVQTRALCLQNTPQLRLDYSRSLYSSDSSAHFAANSGTPGSQLEVVVKRLDEKAQLIEGSFSALALSSPEGKVRITEGKFRLPIKPEAERGK